MDFKEHSHNLEMLFTRYVACFSALSVVKTIANMKHDPHGDFNTETDFNAWRLERIRQTIDETFANMQ